MILGLLTRRDGLPIACDVWPANTADVTRLRAVADTLRQPFALRQVVVVA